MPGPLGVKQSDSSQADVSSPSNGNLTGWAAIEAHLMKNDTGMVREYVDDMDSMLVFAALFSAILTTFVVQTYPLLQSGIPDPTGQLIAYQISSHENHSNIPPAINSTISNFLSPSPTTPSSSVRWLNALFFFSLVISLGAALLAIRAKQWLREYMAWNSPLAAPRENVLVRQIRFEAWQASHVVAIMRSIPVLLELAMILFLAGIALLLWTLDNLVAAAVTVLVVIFLDVVAAFTILPIVRSRCPYKSPSAWMLLRLLHIIRIAVPCFDRLLPVSLGHLAKTWRARDMPTYATPAAAQISQGINQECLSIPVGGVPNIPKDWTYGDHEPLVKHYKQDLTETPILLRALRWVSMASQDPRIADYVDQCMTSIHPMTFQSQTHSIYCQSRALTDWCVIASVTNPGGLDRLRLDVDADPAPLLSGSLSIVELRRRIGVRDDRGQLVINPKFDLFPSNMSDAAIILRLLIADIQYYNGAGNRATSSGPLWMHDASQLRRLVEFVRIIEVFSSRGISPNSDSTSLGKECYRDALLPILDDNADVREWLVSKVPGFRFRVFRLLCKLSKVSVTNGPRRTLVITDGITTADDYFALLHDYFDDRYEQPKDKEDQDILLFVASEMSRLFARSRISLPEEWFDNITTTLLNNLAKAAEIGASRRKFGSHLHYQFEKLFTHIYEFYKAIPGDRDSHALLLSSSSHSVAIGRLLHAHLKLLNQYMQTTWIQHEEKCDVSRYLHEKVLPYHHSFPACCIDMTCPWRTHCDCMDKTCQLLSLSHQSTPLHPLANFGSDSPSSTQVDLEEGGSHSTTVEDLEETTSNRGVVYDVHWSHKKLADEEAGDPAAIDTPWEHLPFGHTPPNRHILLYSTSVQVQP